MQSSKLHVPSLLQLFLSGLGLLTLLTFSGGMALLGTFSLVSGKMAVQQTVGLFSLAWIAGFLGLLLIPSLVYALQRLLGVNRPGFSLQQPWRVSNSLMLLWPIFLVLGEVVQQNATLSWLMLPPLQLLVVAIPLWWFVEIGCRGIHWENRQQRWGLVSFGILVSPPVIIVAELLVIGLVTVPLFTYFGSQPGALEQLNRILQRLANSQADPEVLFRVIQPYLRQPAVIAILLGVVSGLVPVIEELLKSLGLWFFVRRHLSPFEGFGAGLICGAVFALLESMTSLASPLGSGWALMAVGRLGTGMLHIITTGIMGWGLASTWSGGRYFKLAAAFLTSVVLHGIWNIFGILLGVGELAQFSASSLLGRLTTIAPFALIVLALTFFALMIGSNRRLRQEFPVPVQKNMD
jgi:hypothetical protein